MKNSIPVVLITDDSFVMPTSVTIVSLLKNKMPGTSYDVYVVTPGLKRKQSKLLTSLSGGGDRVMIVQGNLEKFAYLHKDENSVAHLSATKAAMLKFDLPNLFPQLDKILYMDGDVIVRGDLSELYAVDLGDHYLGAAHDTGKMYSRAPMVLKFPGYFNSGVMLLNLKKMRECDVTQKLIEAKAAMTGKGLMDQPAFNEVCQSKVIHIHSKWNYLAMNLDRATDKWTIQQLNDLLECDYADKKSFADDAVVIHYSSKEKPWKCYSDSWTDLWLEYYRQSPYAKQLLPWQSVPKPKYEYNSLWERLFSVKNRDSRKIVTFLGMRFKFRSAALRLKADMDELKRRLASAELELSIFRRHRNQLVRISNMYRLPSINRDEIASKVENFMDCGVNSEPRDQKLIISLTSYPKRMYDIHLCLYSLLNQSFKPDAVVLWLAREQFPEGEADIPQKVLALRERGLTIKWCEDIRSYKKLIPSLKEYPDACIVTADDDLYYRETWLESLWNAYVMGDKNTIIAHRCHRVLLKDGSIQPYNVWKKEVVETEASYFNFQTNGGGVLYAPGVLPAETMDIDAIRRLAPNADDVWLWCMAVLGGRKIRTVENPHKIVYINPIREAGLNSDGVLYATNCGASGNDEQLMKVMAAYPEILHRLTGCDR